MNASSISWLRINPATINASAASCVLPMRRGGQPGAHAGQRGQQQQFLAEAALRIVDLEQQKARRQRQRHQRGAQAQRPQQRVNRAQQHAEHRQLQHDHQQGRPQRQRAAEVEDHFARQTPAHETALIVDQPVADVPGLVDAHVVDAIQRGNAKQQPAHQFFQQGAVLAQIVQGAVFLCGQRLAPPEIGLAELYNTPRQEAHEVAAVCECIPATIEHHKSLIISPVAENHSVGPDRARVAAVATGSRSAGFDVLKGLLILLVMLGHVLPGSLEDNPARAAIYFFHMPLFLAVTGFFLRPHHLQPPARVIFGRYFDRMLLPYLIAFATYTLLDWYLQFSKGEMDIKVVVHSVLYPYYHLWYIPAVLLFVFYTKAIESLSRNEARWIALALFGCVGIFYAAFKSQIDAAPWAKFLGDKRYYSYFYFFLLGYLLAFQKTGKAWTAGGLLLAPAFIAIYCVADHSLVRSSAWLIANSAIAIVALGICKSAASSTDHLLSRMGRVTLPIYLWHVLPLILLKIIFPGGGVIYYMAATAALAAVIFCAVAGEGRSRLLGRFFYGTPAAAVALPGTG